MRKEMLKLHPVGIKFHVISHSVQVEHGFGLYHTSSFRGYYICHIFLTFGHKGSFHAYSRRNIDHAVDFLIEQNRGKTEIVRFHIYVKPGLQLFHVGRIFSMALGKHMESCGKFQ